MKTLTFYFGLRSPYSALASDLVHEAVTSGLYEGRVNFRIAPFSNTDGHFLDPTSNPKKLNYMLRDLPRLYGARGLSLGLPDPLDVDFTLATCAALAAQDAGYGTAFLREVSLMRWSEGRNVAEEATLEEAAERAGWEAAAAVDAMRDPECSRIYERATSAADKAGVFGVPFFVVSDGADDEPFWGQDRWPMVEAALRRQ